MEKQQAHKSVQSLEEEEDFLGVICTFLTSSQLYIGLFKFLTWNHLVHIHFKFILG